MIRRIYSDLPTFKDLELRPGLNVLLADKCRGATDKQTRNGAGKSSVLEVIHFLLGSDCKPDSIFRNPALVDAVFGMELELEGSFVRVERRGAKPSPITVAGDFTRWPIEPVVKDNVAMLATSKWKALLGRLMFGLGDVEGARGPSFRSMLSYFVRREREGGMVDPMKSSAMQQLVDQQVNVSFLIGLDWVIPRQWQQVRDREKSLEELKKGMRQGALGSIVGSVSELKSDLIIAEDRVKRLREATTSFKVLEQYEELEKEASRLTRVLAELADENMLDRRYIAELEASTVEEVPPAASDLEALFREVGVVLPGFVQRRFEQVQAFHDSVVRNRRLYLESELTAARQRVEGREQEQRKHDARRSELMGMLKSAGALEHFTSLQSELAQAEAIAESTRQRHVAAEALVSGQVRLKMERAALSERLRREHSEQDEVLKEAVLTFRAVSARLYEAEMAGRLTIDTTENGPVFEAHIPAEKSKGVNNMRIFCFDMLLMLLSLRRGFSPGFLVHDSHLFDGVDERQVANALAVGAGLAKQHGFQYLVTMNSDAVPSTLPSGFHLDDYLLDVRLTDATDDGGLFGLRFE
jgi:uncharacterized protein YydD (DUF2326 family)